MDLVNIIWIMTAAICLTLAGIHLLVVVMKRSDWWQLLFVLAALSTAVMSWFELSMMRAQTEQEFHGLLRWSHIPFGILLTSIT